MEETRKQIPQSPQERAPDFYIGDVVEYQDGYCICAVTVGSVVINQHFPAKLMLNHGLAPGNKFIWYPTEDGSVTEYCVVPVLDEDFFQYEDQELSGFKNLRDRMMIDCLRRILFILPPDLKD